MAFLARSFGLANRVAGSVFSPLVKWFSDGAIRKPVYEFRISRLRPGAIADFLDLTNKFIGIRKQTATLRGFWTSGVGDLNETFQLWEYDGYEQYDEADISLGTNEDWNGIYLKRALPMVERQQSFLLGGFLCAPFTPPADVTKAGVYRLWNIQLRPGALTDWQQKMIIGLKTRKQYSLPVGFFYTLAGDMNRVFHLWRYDSHTHRADVINKAMKDPAWMEAVNGCNPLTERMEHLMLKPSVFSPLQ